MDINANLITSKHLVMYVIINPSEHSGGCVFCLLEYSKPVHLASRMYLRISRNSQCKQPLFPLSALTFWSFSWRRFTNDLNTYYLRAFRASDDQYYYEILGHRSGSDVDCSLLGNGPL